MGAPHSVALRLKGPLQAWGTHSDFEYRDTNPYPTLSGIVGIVACALGLSVHDPLGKLADLDVAVRVDDPGDLLSDFHTSGNAGWISAAGKTSYKEPKLSTRLYLADATFAAALGHEDRDLLDRIDQALKHPRWPLYLGRRSCLPTAPVHVGVFDADPVSTLMDLPYFGRRPVAPSLVQIITTSHDGTGSTMQDVPLHYGARTYAQRTVKRTSTVRHPAVYTTPAPATDTTNDRIGNPYNI